MRTILNKKASILLFCLIILVIGVFTNKTDAKQINIQVSVEVSPNPAKINDTVQIKVTANDLNAANSILSIGFSVNEKYQVGKDFNCANKNTCSTTFKKQFSGEGNYTIWGVANDEDGFPHDSSRVLLSVTQTGALPPPSGYNRPAISGITPSPAPIGSIMTISGINFCPNIDFDTSNNSVIFDQTSVSGGKIITAAPLSQPNDLCSSLKVIVPTDLISNNNVKISIRNNGGSGTPVSLDVSPAGTTPRGSLTIGGTSLEGKLELDWPPSPLGTRLEEDITVLIKYIYEWAISIGGLLVFIILIRAGVQYLTSAGNSGKMSDAIDRIRSAIIGLGILLASVLILNTINPQLTQLKMPPLTLTPEKLNFEIKPDKISGSNECKSATFYGNQNFDSDSKIPGIGENGILAVNREFDGPQHIIQSVELNGDGCIVNLYQLSGENRTADSPGITIGRNISNMQAYVGETKFKSGKVTSFSAPTQ